MEQPFYPNDFDTPIWAKLRRRLIQRLERDRAELEKGVLDEKPLATVRLRARIAELHGLLDLEAQCKSADSGQLDVHFKP